MVRLIPLGALFFVVTVFLAACFKVEGRAQSASETGQIQIAVKPFIARQADTRNLIVELRPDRPIPEGYALVGSGPIVEVDHTSAAITISGVYTFEPSAGPTVTLRRADVRQSFEFGPPEPKVYDIIYVPEEAQGFMTKREINFGPPEPPARSEYLLITPTATVTRNPDTGMMTVALSLSQCVGGLGAPLDDNLMVGVNRDERKILVFGAFRYEELEFAFKYCRVDPENPKRVFQFENTDAGQYEILYERHRYRGKPASWPRIVSGGQLNKVDLSLVLSE